MIMSESNSRPVDILNNAKGKVVMVELKNGHSLTGKLVAFDMHVNLTLENCEEKKDDQTLRKLGNIFVRGDMIVLIAPTI